MGYSGKLREKHKAQELRLQGLSYSEILQHISVSKDTLSRWCKDIILTEEQRIRLINNKQFGQRKGSLVAADNKRQARITETAAIFEKSKLEIGTINKRDQFITGVALYAGEGDKGDRKSAFTNSNPALIKFMMNWFLEFACVPMDRVRGAIWLHEGLSEQEAKKYWSDLTDIPLNQLHKTYIAKNKMDSNKVRKNIHSYGIFSIRFSDAGKQRQILGWISALLGDKIS